MVLGAALPQAQAAALKNMQVRQPVAGREAHNLWTSLSDTTKPSFLLLNRIGSEGKMSTEAFPVVKPAVASSAYSYLQARIVSDPHFSPDGRFLVVKFGELGLRHGHGDGRGKAGVTSLPGLLRRLVVT